MKYGKKLTRLQNEKFGRMVLFVNKSHYIMVTQYIKGEWTINNVGSNKDNAIAPITISNFSLVVAAVRGYEPDLRKWYQA